jgi:hypothetical protein
MRKTIILLGLALMLCGCQHNRPNPQLQAMRQGRLYSPNAEPLSGGPLGHPACQAAKGAWFDRLDTGHTGRLDRDTFMADARRQFDRMDLDHDGDITPAELDSFRAPYEDPLPQPRAPRPENQRADRRQSQPIEPQPHGTDGVDLSADPVMSADVNLRFRVGKDDFLRQAENVFARLDTDHDGTLSRSEVLATCPTVPSP